MKPPTSNGPAGIAQRAARWTVNNGAVDLVRSKGPARRARLSASPHDVEIDLGGAAILVIDFQNDFCAPGGWMAERGVDLATLRAPIAPLNRLLPALRGANVPVIWLNWANRPDRLNLPPSALFFGSRGGTAPGYADPSPSGRGPILARGSWGAAICAELAVDPADIHVDKVRLSGFWHNDLDAILRNLAVTTLFFAGINLDRCVLATLQDAAFLGYDCILVDDCAATSSPQFCIDAAHYLVGELYGFTVKSDQMLRDLASQ